VARNNIRNVTRTRVTVRSLTPSPIAEAVRTQYEERFGNPPEKCTATMTPGGTSFVLDVVRP
jgi:hypothetical protein